jgi:phage-related protein
MRKLVWLGNSKKDLCRFPQEYALYNAQKGDSYYKTKPFKGCGSGVYEIATEYYKNAYRAVYIVNVEDTVYVLHCFQKKSKCGIKTPQEDVEVIKSRLKRLKDILRSR